MVAAGVALAVILSVAAVGPRPARAADGLPGTAQEHLNAWNSLDQDHKKLAMDVFREWVAAPLAAQMQAGGAAAATAAVQPARVSAQSSVRTQLGTTSLPALPDPVAGFATDPDTDLDGDGLPEPFEDQLANLFMPDYHVSGGENGTTGFVRFANQRDQVVSGPVLRQAPPLVHTRVVGVKGQRQDGLLYGYIRVDYLTLWNRDDGYDASALCDISTFGTFSNLISKPHELDNERSALVVAAPVVYVNGQARYNPDPAAYRAFYQYTTAHEDFPATALSRLYSISPPSAPDDHQSLALWLAKKKHGTYPFNPDGQPVILTQIRIVAYVVTIALALRSILDDILFDDPVSFREIVLYAVYYVVDVILNVCFTESFSEQGPSRPTDPLNVGEPDRTLPGFAFAGAGEVRGKLLGRPIPTPAPQPATPARVSVDWPLYRLDQPPLYNVDGQANSGVFWSSSVDGAPTGEVGAYYGHRTDGQGHWSGYGGSWPQAGKWTKSVQVGGQTGSATFTVTAGAGVALDSALYEVGSAPYYVVVGPPRQPIFWSSTRNGVSTGEVNAFYGQYTDDTGRWSGYGGAWSTSHVGAWTKSVVVGGQSGSTRFSVLRPPPQPRTPTRSPYPYPRYVD